MESYKNHYEQPFLEIETFYHKLLFFFYSLKDLSCHTSVAKFQIIKKNIIIRCFPFIRYVINYY